LWDKEICYNNWSSEVCEIFSEFELEYAFEDMSQIDIQQFEALMVNRTAKTWKDTIAFKPKLRTYVKFKTDYGTEEYVTGYMSRYQRSLLAQFRGGILPLRIETGRWQNMPLESRLCTLCGDNCVEDEFHFLCGCKIYEDQRKKLYAKACQSNPLFQTTKSLFI
jgi:hypothetical protein